MRRALDIQFWGAALVLGAFIAAELAAEALWRWPGSPIAWWAHLRLFPAFEAARAEASPLRGLFGPNALPAALGLLGILIWLRACRSRLGLALAANGAFAFAATLAAPALWPAGERLASLGGAARPATGGDAWLLAILLAASFAAAALSHLSFALAIAQDLRRGRPGPA